MIGRLTMPPNDGANQDDLSDDNQGTLQGDPVRGWLLAENVSLTILGWGTRRKQAGLKEKTRPGLDAATKVKRHAGRAVSGAGDAGLLQLGRCWQADASTGKDTASTPRPG